MLLVLRVSYITGETTCETDQVSQGDSEEAVEAWSEQIENELSATDAIVDKLSECLEEIAKKQQDHKREEELGKELAYDK